jgi:hypothetical protein
VSMFLDLPCCIALRGGDRSAGKLRRANATG